MAAALIAFCDGACLTGGGDGLHPERRGVVEVRRVSGVGEPYRRLMALHAAHGHLDAVTATWQLLKRRLGDLDVDMDETTARLYRTLTTTDTPSTSQSVRLSS